MHEPEVVAVVTGGNGGLGLAISQVLAGAAMHVCLADISREGAEQSAQTLRDEGFSASAHVVDVASQADMERLGAEAAAHGRLVAWVNNAGIANRTPIIEESLDGWNRVMGINATGAFLGTQIAARQMTSGEGGSIVNISSICANRAILGNAAYGASKAAVVGMTIHAALELASSGIRVNAVLPGTIFTPMTSTRLSNPEQAAWSNERIPTGRPGTAAEVAALVAFLCSPAASYINGAAIPCDGGWGSHA